MAFFEIETMNIDLDLSSIYYFLWSIAVLFVLCAQGELLKTIASNLLDAARIHKQLNPV